MQLTKVMNLGEVITIATELGIQLASFITSNKGVHTYCGWWPCMDILNSRYSGHEVYNDFQK